MTSSSFSRLRGCWLAALLAGAYVLCISMPAVRGADEVWQSPPAKAAGGPIVFQSVLVEDQDEQPAAAGKAAAQKLKAAMGDVPLKAVIVSECFEDAENKQALLAGIASVIPAEIVFGQSTYGSFTQAGSGGFDTVCLLGIGGDGIGVCGGADQGPGRGQADFRGARSADQAAFAGCRRHVDRQARARTPSDRLAVLMADAHSPKNQFLVEGAQQTAGRPISRSPAAARTRTPARRSSTIAGQTHER
jgi:hypothetical protein